MQASSTRGFLTICSHNMVRRIFKLAHILLGLVIIREVTAATQVPPPKFIAKGVTGTFTLSCFGVSNFRNLLHLGSSRFRSRSRQIFLVSGALACLFRQGMVVFEVPFLVASK